MGHCNSDLLICDQQQDGLDLVLCVNTGELKEGQLPSGCPEAARRINVLTDRVYG